MLSTTTASILSDAQLVALARTGDQDSFGELLRRHRQKCVDLATFFLRNRGDAEDEVQNAFSKAYAHLDQYQGEAEFATWLVRDIKELPMTDGANQFGITVPAAKSRLLRARTELRSRLMRHTERSGSGSQLSRTAAPINRVAHHRAMRPCLSATA